VARLQYLGIMKTPLPTRLLTSLGHLLFALLCAMAAWFWQERTLILDAAFQSCHFIAEGRPIIMVERFGAVAVQILPLLGVWTGASLATVLLLYSVAIVLFHWCAFSICLHILKDQKAALAILLFNVLLVGDSFYWMQNELLQAVALLFVLWSVWLRRGHWTFFTRWDWTLSLLLATTVAYYHPLIFFPLAFCWSFFWLKSYSAAAPLSKQMLLGIAVLFAGIFSSKYIFREANFYDRGMTGQYVREFNLSFERLLHAQSMRDLLAHLSDNFLLLLPLLAIVIGYYTWKKQFWEAALVLSSVLGYCLLILQRFLDDDRWYIQESHYQALAVFLIVPLVWDILPDPGLKLPGLMTRYKPWLFALVMLLLMIRLSNIWNTHSAYTARLAYVRRLLEKTKAFEGRKFVIDETQADRKVLLMYWGLPFETLQISALQSPDSLRVMAIAKNPDSLAAHLSPGAVPTFLMMPGPMFRDLPKRYYRMRDTSAYRPIEFR
jgi:hypothetical protein